MVDFRFYLNKQGIRGQKGEKGDTGFSPSIVEEVNTLTDYRLKIINEFDEFVTDNLRGSDYFDITDPNGTYLRFDKETGRAYTGALDQATSEAVGGARLASTSDMDSFSENTIVTPALFADSLANLIVSPDGSLNITQNEQTSKTEITFNSSTLDAVRAEINRVKQDLETESQTRLNADNQQQVAIDAERREREIQDNALQNQLSHLSDSYVTLSTEQDITGRKYFSNTIRGRDIALGIDKANNTWGILGSSTNSLTMGDSAGTIGFSLYKATSTSSPHFDINSADVRFTKGVPSVTQSGSKDYLVTQNNVFAGDNITVTKFGNGVKISSTGGAGAIIDDGDPATDKVYSSSKTSDLVGELGNEVNGIAGRLNTLEGEVKVATTENLGLVQPDGTTITIDSDGKITAVGGGDLPDNVVTTDTNQSISGSKIFEHHTLKISNEDNSMSSLVADFLTDAISIGKDGTSAISDRLKLAQPTVGKFYKEKAEVKFTPSGIVVDTWLSNVVSVDDIKAGNNIQLTKDQSSGEVTISATGGGSAPEVDNVTIEINEEGKLQTTVDINELQSKVEDLQLYKFPNATIEGDPTINNGQVSNFSTTNYLRFPFEFETKGRTWLLNGSFDTGSDVTTQQNIIDSLASVALAVRSGRLVLALSTNGTSFDLGEHLSMSDIEPNTKYYFKLSFSGTQYLLSLSTDKIDYMPEAVVSSTSPIASKPMTISSSGHPYGDTINLNDWDLTVADVLVWQGMDDVGVASRLDVNVSNITETGKQAIKDIVNVDGKEDKLTPKDGIIIRDELAGFCEYSDTFKDLINNKQTLNATSSYDRIDILNTPLDNDKSLHISFTYKQLTNEPQSIMYMYLIGNSDFYISNVYKNYSVYQFDCLFAGRTYNVTNIPTTNIRANDKINIEVDFDYSTGNISTIVKNLTLGIELGRKNGVSPATPPKRDIKAYLRSDAIPLNNYYEIYPEDIKIGYTDNLTKEHQILANIDNETIISDNGVLKAVTGSGDSYSKEETDNLLADKQDKLTAGDGINIREGILNAYEYSNEYKSLMSDSGLKLNWTGLDVNTMKPITNHSVNFATEDVLFDVIFDLKNVAAAGTGGFVNFNLGAINDSVTVSNGFNYLYWGVLKMTIYNGRTEQLLGQGGVNIRSYVGHTLRYTFTWNHTTQEVTSKLISLTDDTVIHNETMTSSVIPQTSYIYSPYVLNSNQNGNNYINIKNYDVTIGSTLDNTKKDIISLNLSTPHIIDTFVDGTSGYRIWSDGYCEQWGVFKLSPAIRNVASRINLVKKYIDIDYNVDIQGTSLQYNNAGTTSSFVSEKTVNSFVGRVYGLYDDNIADGFYWKTTGYLAEGEY